MKEQREIPKSVPAPDLFPDEAIELVTELCFLTRNEASRENMVGSYGEVLIFGTSHPTSHEQIADAFAGELCDDLYLAEIVYITGGATKPGIVESEAILTCISARFDVSRQSRSDYSKIDFRLDRDSRDTLGNVECAIKLGLGSGDTGIIFIAKSGHCGRCKLTLSRLLPRKKVHAWGYDAILSDGIPPVNRDTWFQNPKVRDLVWGEFLRIELYGEGGNIAYPDKIRQNVERVRVLTRT